MQIGAGGNLRLRSLGTRSDSGNVHGSRMAAVTVGLVAILLGSAATLAPTASAHSISGSRQAPVTQATTLPRASAQEHSLRQRQLIQLSQRESARREEVRQQALIAAAARRWRSTWDRPAGTSTASLSPSATLRPAALPLTGTSTISGTVTGGGSGLVGVCVYASATDGNFVPGTTGSGGAYSLTSMPADSYQIEFDPTCNGTISSGYTIQYYNDASSPAGATLVPVTAGATVGGIDATLTLGATISGTVTASGGGGLVGVCVSAFGASGGFGTAKTGSGGLYSIPALPADSYEIEFDPTCGGTTTSTYAIQYYNGVASPSFATSVTVVAGGSYPGINAALTPGATISGTVSAGGSGLAGVCVYAYSASGSSSDATTVSGGGYSISGLSAAGYLVEFDPSCSGGVTSPYAIQYYNDASSPSTATTVSVVTGGAATGIDATLVLGGSISGTVTGGGSGLSGVCVTASARDGNFGAAPTGTGGTFTISSLVPDTYTVEFDPTCTGATTYAAQYYQDAFSPQTATPVTVSSGATATGIDATLTLGATISGVVTAAGSGVSGVCVYASAADGNFSPATTAANGTYTISALPADSYSIEFDPSCSGSVSTGYAAQFYNGANSVAAASLVTVAAGAAATGIDASLAPGATISGTVTAGGTGLGSACVVASAADGNSGFANTNSNGSYTITGLAADSYTVEFEPGCRGATTYATQYYNDATAAGKATLVVVAVGAAKTEINATLALGATISGTVTAAGTGSAGVCVVAYAADFNFGTTTTTASGSYTIDGLPADTYKVEFDPTCGGTATSTYATQYYDGANSPSTASSLTVAAGGAQTGIDAILGAGATISGTVTAGGTGVADVCVEASAKDGNFGSATTGGAGTYTIDGLPADSYVIEFDPTCAGAAITKYAIQYYSGASSPATAGSVTLTTGEAATAVNAALGLGGSISGMVTAGSNTLGDVCIYATATDGNFGYASSGAGGVYSMDGLPADSYTVEFDPTCGGAIPSTYAIQYYNGASLASSATLVVVSAGGARTGIDAALVAQSGPAVPGAPTNLGAIPGASQIALVWSPPASQGSSAITSYTATGTDLTTSSGLTPVTVTGTPPATSTLFLSTVPGDTYSFSVTASNSVGAGPASPPFVVVAPAPYFPVVPTRICDTRPVSETGAASDQCTGHTLGAAGAASETLTVQVTGGVVPATATAVVANITVTGPTQGGFLTVWPAGATQPLASNLNFTAGETVPNLVTVPLSSSGAIDIFNHAGQADVIVDVEGYYGPGASGAPGVGFSPLAPTRICDTRPVSQTGVASDPCTGHTLGAAGAASETLKVQVTGTGLVPNSATAVVANVTVTNATQSSYLTVWPAGATKPLASNLNFTAGETVPNRVIVPLSSSGAIDIFNLAGQADVIVDINGYYDASSPGLYEPVIPTRICDTRPVSQTGALADQCTGHTVGAAGASETMEISVASYLAPEASLAAVPSSATAVVANVTVTNTTQSSFLTVWPAALSRPTASDLNWVAGDTVPNLVIVELGSSGGIEVFNHAGAVDVIVDVEGWFT